MTAIVILSIVLFMVIINLIPPRKNIENNPFVVADGERGYEACRILNKTL